MSSSRYLLTPAVSLVQKSLWEAAASGQSKWPRLHLGSSITALQTGFLLLQLRERCCLAVVPSCFSVAARAGPKGGRGAASVSGSVPWPFGLAFRVLRKRQILQVCLACVLFFSVPEVSDLSLFGPGSFTRVPTVSSLPSSLYF